MKDLDTLENYERSIVKENEISQEEISIIEEEMSEKIDLLEKENCDNLLLIEELKSQLENAKKDVEEAQESERLAYLAVKEKEDKIESLEEKILDDQLIIEELNNTIDNTQKQLDYAQESEKSLREEKEKMEKELKDRIEYFIKESNEKDCVVEELKLELKNIRKDVMEVQNSEKLASRAIQEKETQINSLEKENFDSQVLIDELTKELKSTQKRLEETHVNEIKNLEELINVMVEEKNYLNEELKQKNKELTSLSEGIIEAKYEFKEYLKDMEENFPEMKKLYKQSNLYGRMYNLLFYSLEGMIRFNELNPHFSNAFVSLKKVFENTKPRCVLISQNLCDFESSDGEIYGNREDIKPLIEASCGCTFHNSCLKSALAIRNYNVGENIDVQIDFKCPKCNKNAKVKLY